MRRKLRIALVHDYLVQYGGAERVLECFLELFPKAPIYTLVYNKEALGEVFGSHDIRCSFLQKIPFTKSEHHFFPVLMPLAVEQFDLSYYDLVLSDTSSYGKGIITNPNTLHISYCHTPMRYAWDDCHKYIREFNYPAFIKKIIPPAMNYLRLWDWAAAARVDHFIANSKLVRRRIEKYYKRESEVINPPIFFDDFHISKRIKRKIPEDYYLMVGRLVSYKKFDLAIRAFNKLGFRLKIVGGGVLLKRLKKMAGPNIEFIGPLKSSGKKLRSIYAAAKALIYPQEEDFGLVPLESMAAGRPVIAYKKGGALETVQDGETGVFFEKQNEKALVEAVKRFEKMKFDREKIQQHAKKFNKERFKRKISEYIEARLREKTSKN